MKKKREIVSLEVFAALGSAEFFISQEPAWSVSKRQKMKKIVLKNLRKVLKKVNPPGLCDC